MQSARPNVSSPPAVSLPLSWLGRWRRMSPLARHIAVILVVKALVLYALWLAFFSAPVARHMTMDPKAVELKVAGPGANTHTERPHAVR